MRMQVLHSRRQSNRWTATHPESGGGGVFLSFHAGEVSSDLPKSLGQSTQRGVELFLRRVRP